MKYIQAAYQIYDIFIEILHGKYERKVKEANKQPN